MPNQASFTLLRTRSEAMHFSFLLMIVSYFFILHSGREPTYCCKRSSGINSYISPAGQRGSRSRPDHATFLLHIWSYAAATRGTLSNIMNGSPKFQIWLDFWLKARLFSNNQHHTPPYAATLGDRQPIEQDEWQEEQLHNYHHQSEIQHRPTLGDLSEGEAAIVNTPEQLLKYCCQFPACYDPLYELCIDTCRQV